MAIGFCSGQGFGLYGPTTDGHGVLYMAQETKLRT